MKKEILIFFKVKFLIVFMIRNKAK